MSGNFLMSIAEGKSDNLVIPRDFKTAMGALVQYGLEEATRLNAEPAIDPMRYRPHHASKPRPKRHEGPPPEAYGREGRRDLYAILAAAAHNTARSGKKDGDDDEG